MVFEVRRFSFVMKLTKRYYTGSLENGKLFVPGDRIKADMLRYADEPVVEITIAPERREKTHAQLAVFHGPIIEQIQSFYMAVDGVYKSDDRIKEELKNQFLPKVPQFYSDGSPVIIKVRHPEKKGVFYDWHFEKAPSLADLSIEQMRGFISEILEYFLHERGLEIQIDTSISKRNRAPER